MGNLVRSENCTNGARVELLRCTVGGGYEVRYVVRVIDGPSAQVTFVALRSQERAEAVFDLLANDYFEDRGLARDVDLTCPA